MEQTRRRLCLIALDLYRHQGYEAVSLRELGKVAGLSHATLYRYFESKEDLFVHVRAEVFRQLDDYVRARDRKSADPLERLRGIVSSLASFGRSSPDDYRLIFSMRQGICPADSPLTLARQHLGNHVVHICQLAIDAGQLQVDASEQAYVAWACMHGLISLHVSNLLFDGPGVDKLLSPMIDKLFPAAPKPTLAPAAANRTKKSAGKKPALR